VKEVAATLQMPLSSATRFWSGQLEKGIKMKTENLAESVVSPSTCSTRRLSEAHTDAVNSGDQFAEVAIHSVLKKAMKFYYRLERLRTQRNERRHHARKARSVSLEPAALAGGSSWQRGKGWRCSSFRSQRSGGHTPSSSRRRMFPSGFLRKRTHLGSHWNTATCRNRQQTGSPGAKDSLGRSSRSFFKPEESW